MCGIDLILEYLKGLCVENCFISSFPRDEVSGLLSRMMPEYEELYLDNLCDPVLFHAAGRIIADGCGADRDRDIALVPGKLEMTALDLDRIRMSFENKTAEEATQHMRGAIGAAAARHLPGLEPYFLRAAEGYVSLIQNGIRYGCLDVVFHVGIA